MNNTEFLDTLEGLIIKSCLPLMEIVKKEVPSIGDMDTYEMTRAIIGKIGVRIAFGKEIADKMIMKELDKT